MKNKKLVFLLLVLFSLLPLIIISLLLKKTVVNLKTSEKQMISIRKAAVAGSFYPQEKETLTKQVDDLGENSSKQTSTKLKILIVPHAGVDYSGSVAAAGFSQIESYDFSKVIILGISHGSLFQGAAIDNHDLWETPLGQVQVDQELAEKIIDQEASILFDRNPHEKEHSLEMELIFLQKNLFNFKIVPILLGQTDEKTREVLANKISAVLDSQTLLVISSDLSHYPTWEAANNTDGQTINAILTGDPKEFAKTIAVLESQNIPNLVTAACGAPAIEIGLMVARCLKINDIQKIAYKNSGDISGDKSRVVGYAAVSIWENNNEILSIARKTLEQYLKNRQIPEIIPHDDFLKQKLGAFVTLRTSGELRGCIGEFEPDDPLYKVVQNMATASATEDPRFPPVTVDELKDIKIEISVMSPRKKIADWRKIRLGIDGVVIRSGNRAGTFLPQVATETGWNLEEFLSHLCSEKAGLSFDCYKDSSTEIYTFEVKIFEEK